MPNSPAPTTGLRTFEPDLKTLFDRRKREWSSDLNCISIGTIQAFDSEKQTATVSINFIKKIKGYNKLRENQSSDRYEPYPILVNCPVIFLFGGSGSLTFPIQSGDTCLVLFCDRDMDTWYQTGQANIPLSERTHDLNDAIALVGIRSLANVLSSYNTSGVQLTFGNNLLAIEDKIKLEANSVTLRLALDTLCDALSSWVDTNGDTPNPATLAAIAAAKALIDTVLK